MSLFNLSPERSIASVATIVACIAVACKVGLVRRLLRIVLPDEEDPTILDTNAAIRIAFLAPSQIDPAATSSLAQLTRAYDESRGQYNFQRRISGPPLLNMDLPRHLTGLQRSIQKKEFLWIAGSNADWHVGVALLQFQFIGVLAVNIWDVKNGTSYSRKVEVPLAALLGAGPEFRAGHNGHCSPASDGHEVVFGDYPLCGGCRASVRFVAVGAAIHAMVRFSGEVSTTPASCNHRPGRHHGRRHVAFEYTVRVPTDYLNVVFPIGPHRASMVAKFAGAPMVYEGEGVAPPRIQWDRSVSWTLLEPPPAAPGLASPQPFLAALDYTRGLLRRETTWYWACVSTVAHRRLPVHKRSEEHPLPLRADNVHQLVHLPTQQPCDPSPVRIGFHFSSGTYDDAKSRVSFECTVYIDGRVVLFQWPVKFSHDGGETAVSTSTLRSVWRIEHDDSSRQPSAAAPPCPHRLQLTFTPADAHLGHFNYLVIRGALLHYWGLFSGSVWVDGEEYVITAAPGVVEDHYALW